VIDWLTFVLLVIVQDWYWKGSEFGPDRCHVVKTCQNMRGAAIAQSV